MGKLKNLKSFIGKVGDLVGYERNGKYYVRSAPKRKAPLTPAESVNRNTFGMVSKWAAPIHPFLRVGFHGLDPDRHALNIAKSVLHREALIKEDGPPRIDPALVRVSSGPLELPGELQVVLNPQRELEFIWNPAAPLEANPRDRLMMLAYNPQERSCFHDTFGPRRSTGQGQLPLDGSAEGSYHVYVAFVSEDLKKCSESRYLGVWEV